LFVGIAFCATTARGLIATIMIAAALAELSSLKEYIILFF
jgi:hypothetical protein